MASRSSIYSRLTGRKRTLTGYSQLWLGPDHILLVKSNRFAEEYRRFSFSDIQAIVVTALPERTELQVAGVGAAVLWTLGFLAVTSVFAKALFLATGILGLAAAAADIARGQRCRCHLHTAVSRELLAPVSRLKTARTFLALIQPAIESVQGSFPSEKIAALDTPGELTEPGLPPAVPRARGHLPEILFCLLLLDGWLVLLDLRLPRLEISNVLSSTFLVELVLAIVVLVRRDPRRVVYGLAVIAILGMGWDLAGLGRSFVNWFGQIVQAAQNGEPSRSVLFSWAPSQRVALVAAAWRITAGIIGLTAAFFERRAEARG